MRFCWRPCAIPCLGSHRTKLIAPASGRVGQNRGSPVNDWSGFPRHFGRNVQPSFSELLSSIDTSDNSGRRSYSIYLSGPRSREPKGLGKTCAPLIAASAEDFSETGWPPMFYLLEAPRTSVSTLHYKLCPVAAPK